MTWRNNLKPASFKGVQFFIEDIDLSGGRRVASFEFPKLDTPSTEDLGKKQKTITVNGYILGDDYLEKSNELLNACEGDEKPGTLIHPFRGEIQVRCQDIKIRETSKDGGIAFVSISFIEAGNDLFPSASLDKYAAVSSAKNASIESMKNDFNSSFNVIGKGQHVSESAASRVGAWSDAITSSMSGVKGNSNSLNDISYNMRNLKSSAIDAIKTPKNVSDIFSSSLSSIGSSLSVKDVGSAFSSYKNIYKKSVGPISLKTPLTESRKQELVNSQAMDSLVKNIARVEASEQAVYVKHASVNDAIIAREEVLTELDEILETTNNDETFISVTQLRNLVIELLPGDTQLPSVSSKETEQVESSLTLAYSIYGSVEKESDLIERNKIDHPAFISSGKKIEYINE